MLFELNPTQTMGLLAVSPAHASSCCWRPDGYDGAFVAGLVTLSTAKVFPARPAAVVPWVVVETSATKQIGFNSAYIGG
jgi:hypothetical protein